MIIRCDWALTIIYLSWLFNIYSVILFTVKFCFVFSQQFLSFFFFSFFFFFDETIKSSYIFSRECYSLTSPDPVYPDLVGELVGLLWERL